MRRDIFKSWAISWEEMESRNKALLEQELDQQPFGHPQVLKSLRHGGIGVDKLGQDLGFHQVEIQEMFGQVTAGFFLPEQGRSQLFGFQDSGFNYALRQVHVSCLLKIFSIRATRFNSALRSPACARDPGMSPAGSREDELNIASSSPIGRRSNLTLP